MGTLPGMTQRYGTIAWLGEPACRDPALVGGKAATLSRLAAGRRVPPGFCLTTRAYAAARNHCAGRVGGEVFPHVLPPSTYHELADAYRRLGERAGVAEPPVAVRSSAVDEDGQAASYAGQHATYLHVAGIDAVAEAVLRCWASATTSQAWAYRRARGDAAADVQIAVLVQHLILADCSAVLFTAHPLTGSRDELLITASWGLGESLVGGTVTPDTYVVRKADLTVLASRIALKQRMTVAIPGGTEEVDVPRFLRTQQVLHESQIVEIARLGLELEAVLGRPVDVECAYQSGRLHLLQCRPITALTELWAS